MNEFLIVFGTAEANREGEPGFAGILYIAGLSLYGLMSLTIQ